MGTNAVAAFFDIDHTVLEINSGTKWIGYQWKTRQISPWQLAEALLWLAQYRFGLLDYDAMARKVLARHRGDAVAPVYEEVAAWFDREVRWSICTQAREAIESHRDQGHTLVLLTSATPFLSKPVADLLDVPHFLCTKLEVVDGKLTGKHDEPACYGPGKVAHAERFAAEHDLDLEASHFYSDSISDLPMLARVGHPHVVNPDPRLRREALARGWPLAQWTAEGQPPKDNDARPRVR